MSKAIFDCFSCCSIASSSCLLSRMCLLVVVFARVDVSCSFGGRELGILVWAVGLEGDEDGLLFFVGLGIVFFDCIVLFLSFFDSQLNLIVDGMKM